MTAFTVPSGPYLLPDDDLESFKRKTLSWVSRFSVFVYLNSNNYRDKYGSYELLIGAGLRRDFSGGSADETLQNAAAKHSGGPGWLFATLPYEAGEELAANGPAAGETKIWEPEIVISVSREQNAYYIYGASNPDAILEELQMAQASENVLLPAAKFCCATSRDTYLATVENLRQKIAAGDFYEINYCLHFLAPAVSVADPAEIYHALNAANAAPFSALYRNEGKYLICTSPERYLCKRAGTVISQPIKGTSRRGKTPDEDARLKEELQYSEKERAENIMIVDLVRSDLAKSCVPGSIRIEELCGIYTFPAVHQMISTISGTLKPDCPLTDSIRHSFPMGSMTGAPKVEVMKNITAVETECRGLYSGALGYFSPEGDFDFNVVIRSLIYDAHTKELRYSAGGAITWDSVPEEEWEEIRLKAAAMENLFQ